jgi:outer membrane receptor protein involved in Fe transport
MNICGRAIAHRRAVHKGRLVCATVLLAAVSAGIAGVAQAQSAERAQPAQLSGQLQAVVVTGTLIPAGSTETISPVTEIGSSQIKEQGATRIEDLLNDMPQVYAALSTSSPPGSTANSGTATVNLRDLGSQRTLVLVNGRRLMPGDPLSGQAADLNIIPSFLVKRIDVVTGGASATYGSDAVAGVVNFMMQDHLQGLHVDVQYSGYQNDNDNGKVQPALKSSGIAVPGSATWDGGTLDADAALGLNTANGSGNITLYVGYRRADPVYAQSRDYSACQLSSGSSFGCVLGSVTSPASFRTVNGSGGVTGNYTIDPTTGNTLIPYSASYYGYNGSQNYLQAPATRTVGGAFAHYDITPHIQFYAELMGMENQSYLYQTPAGTYGHAFSVACDNPMLSAQEESVVCGSSPLTSSATLDISQRNLLGGPRIDDVDNLAYRMVGGLRGEFGDGWHFDFYAQNGVSHYSESMLNSISTTKIQNALDVVENASGNLECAVAVSGIDSSCSPYNIFAAGGITQQAVNYIEVPATTTGSTGEQVVNGMVTKSLSDYGIVSPYATDGVSIAVGSQYRRESLALRPDEEWQGGDLTGAGTELPVSGSFHVYELYDEVSVPLIQGRPGAENLSVDGGYRYSHYSSVGGSNTYKFGVAWSPVKDVRFRASYQQAIRAPSVVELYSGRRLTLFGGIDPCDGAAPVDSLTACENTGVTPAEYGNIPAQNNQQPSALSGGNPNLKPEESTTRSFGATFSPAFVPGLSLSMDYFDIGISNVIGTISPTLALTQCAATDNSTYCGLIHRAPGSGVLFTDVDGYVIATEVNLGSMHTSGVDFQVDYPLELERLLHAGLGTIDLSLVGTYLDEYVVQPVSGLGSYDCEGLYGPTCGEPLPRWRHQVRASWHTPWHGLGLSLAWRYTAAVDLEKTSSNPSLSGVVPPSDARLGAVNYLDAALSMPIRSGWTLRVGVNNLLDRDPPLLGTSDYSSPGADNTFPGMYDAMGRYLFMDVTGSL